MIVTAASGTEYSVSSPQKNIWQIKRMSDNKPCGYCRHQFRKFFVEYPDRMHDVVFTMNTKGVILLTNDELAYVMQKAIDTVDTIEQGGI